jgi:hypothetical protein
VLGRPLGGTPRAIAVQEYAEILHKADRDHYRRTGQSYKEDGFKDAHAENCEMNHAGSVGPERVRNS